MRERTVIVILIVTLLVLFLFRVSLPRGERYEDLGEVPAVSFPFRNLLDDNGKRLNIILLTAPFRGKDHEDQYELYKSKGLNFCGISSYLNYPDKIYNPFEDRYHEDRKHDYVGMVSAWLYCTREPSENIKRVPHLLMTEADLKNTNHYVPLEEGLQKEYDYIIVCLEDNAQCLPGWNSYNRNWELSKKCIDVLCKRGLKGVVIGRNRCNLKTACEENDGVTHKGMLPFHEFSKEMKKSRMLIVPNIYDASPRIITEAICYDMPVIVNKHILGGWHNVISGVTGEFFESELDLPAALDKVVGATTYTPRDWYIKNRSLENSGVQLRDFLVQNYPNLNNKTMKYASITI